jgi:serine/threonine protein kinase
MKQCVVHQIIYLRKNQILKFFFTKKKNFFFNREIASRTPHSFATDVWSLGILIVTLLTGHPPFDTDSMFKKSIYR